MNRSQLRFLGMQHDTLAQQGGSQKERDRLLALIDGIAQQPLQPRVGDRVVLWERRPGHAGMRTVTITDVTPLPGRVQVSWLDDRGRWGSFEQTEEPGYWGTYILRRAA